MTDFASAYARLTDAQHEDAYVCDKNDPGGETYKGIARNMSPSWAGWPRIDAAKGQPNFPGNLESDSALQAMAQSFYKTQYWDTASCDNVPSGIRYELFDFAVNTSQPGHPVTAVRALQRAAMVADDGSIGQVTLLALQTMDPARLTLRFAAQVIRYYTGLKPDLKVLYLSGWMNRLATNLEML